MGPAAFLSYSNRIYFSRVTALGLAETPVTHLIEGIWDHFPDQAFHLLRCRIFTNYPLTSTCRGSIKLAAKRCTELQPVDFQQRMQSQAPLIEIVSSSQTQSEVPIPNGIQSQTELIQWMKDFPFDGKNRPILAVLLDRKGNPISAHLNQSSRNRLHHAEVNLIRDFVRKEKRKIPAGCQLVVSLKPCWMCAAHLADCSEAGIHFSVTYLQDDPGPKARLTPLTRLKLLED